MDQDATPATPSRTRRLVIGCAKLIVSLGLLALLFSRTDVNSIWEHVHHASGAWLLAGLTLYAVSVGVAAWRWGLLCDAQGMAVRTRTLFTSYLVANFFNNFLPSNIGGDVVRIRDTAGPAGSKTLATTVVLFDRAIGLMGVVLTAAIGASVAAGAGSTAAALPVVPSWLWAGFLLATVVGAPAVIAPEGVGRLLQPLTVFHPEWVGDRISKITETLERFRDRPSALFGGFAGAMTVQAVMVLFYAAVAHSFNIPITTWHLAVVVPVSFVVQMLPVSVNGFGVREATFSFYFTRIGLPIGSAIALSLGAQALIMLFSLTGAGCYVMRRHPHRAA
jgi:glycosyltransferase 2 family protein